VTGPSVLNSDLNQSTEDIINIFHNETDIHNESVLGPGTGNTYMVHFFGTNETYIILFFLKESCLHYWPIGHNLT
jgi:hypothetical protein